MSKEANLSSSIREAARALESLRTFVLTHAMIDTNVSLEEKSRELSRIAASNRFCALRDSIKGICEDRRLNGELYGHFSVYRDALKKIYVPDSYMQFVAHIHLAAYDKFRETKLAREMSSAWKTLPLDFIDKKTGGLIINSPAGAMQWFGWDKKNYPVLTEEAVHKLNKDGFLVERGLELAQVAADTLAQQWNKALQLDKVVKPIQVFWRSPEHPEEHNCVTTHCDGSSHYTLEKDGYYLADLRALFHTIFHEPEHALQEHCRCFDKTVFNKIPIGISSDDYKAMLNLSLFAPSQIFAVDKQESNLKDETLGAIAYDAYRRVIPEITAHQHGFLAEMQLARETATVPASFHLREFIASDSCYTRAVPPFLLKSTRKLLAKTC